MSEDKLQALFLRAQMFGVWPNPEALYIVITRELGPFRWEWASVPSTEPDFAWPEYVGLIAPKTGIVPRGACCAKRFYR